MSEIRLNTTREVYAVWLSIHAFSRVYQSRSLVPRFPVSRFQSPPTVNLCIAVRKVATPLWELTCHMASHSVTCHPAEVAFPPLPMPKLVFDLATPEGCKAELRSSWLVTYRDGIPARRRSPIQVLTGPDVGQQRDATLARYLLSSCVRLSVHHSPVLCRNNWTNRAGFGHGSFPPPVHNVVIRKFGYLQT